MHFSAQRGIAIARHLSVCLSVRLSVCLSVTLVDCDHIGWNISEIISLLVSLGCSLSADPNIMGLLQGEHPQIWAQIDPPLLISASETFDSKLRPIDYRQRNGHNGEPKLPSLFLMVPSLTSYDLSFPLKMGVPYAPRYANGHISATGDPIHFMFGSRVGFSGSVDRMALFTVRTNPRWRPPPCWRNFKWRYLRNRSSDPLHVLF